MNNYSVSQPVTTRFRSSLQLRAAAELERRRRAGKLNVVPVWQPNPDKDGIPNPQRLALESKADEILFGGQAGGGKTNLILGVAFTQHKRSAIFRRVYPNLKSIIQDSIDLIGSDDCYNKTEKTWRIDGRIVEFGAVQYEADVSGWRGRPHDLKAFDELPEFSKGQYHFIIGWNRSTDPNQRCRVVATCNPPDTDEGMWIIEAWAPWLDDQFPDPANPGELRWYYYDANEKIVWLKSGEPIEVNGEMITPRSRTFIPSTLADNPYLSGSNTYRSVLQSLPEPLRSQLLKGDFKATAKANPWQVIPTAWVKLAQKRWLERERPNTPLSAVGIDAVRGGKDKLTVAKRYDNYIDEVYKVPGVMVDDGPALAAIVWRYLNGESPNQYMNIDVIGVGSSGYDSLKTMYKNVTPLNAAAGSDKRDKSGKLKMRNIRAAYYWDMREALDPVNGDDLALPPGNEIVADLCAATWENTTAGVTIEPKEKIKERLGRSPDTGEAILFAKWRTTRGVFVG
jgi:hypothetical protein